MRRALLWLCVAMLGATGAAISGPVSGDPAPEGEIAIQVSPGTIALNAQTVWLTIHANIPYGAVDPQWVVVEVQGTEVAWTAMFDDSLGDLVVKCPIGPVRDLFGDDDEVSSADVVLIGVTKGGEDFVGYDTVKVVPGGGK